MAQDLRSQEIKNPIDIAEVRLLSLMEFTRAEP